MSGPTYISNPSLWEQFRHTKSGENFIPSLGRTHQRGGRILNRRKAYMIPVRPTDLGAGIQQVTSVAAETQRALSEFKEVERNNEPHMPLKNTIKRGNKSRKLSRSTTGRRNGRKNHKQKKSKHQPKRRFKIEENVKIYQQKNINVKTKNRQETHILGETGQQKKRHS